MRRKIFTMVFFSFVIILIYCSAFGEIEKTDIAKAGGSSAMQ